MGLWLTRDFQQLLLVDDDAAYSDPFSLVDDDGTERLFYRVTVPVAAWVLGCWKKFRSADAAGKIAPQDSLDTAAQFNAVFDWVKDNLDTELVKKFDVRRFSFPEAPEVPV